MRGNEMEGAMWMHIWRGSVQLFYIAAILLVFSQLHGRLEIIVVSLFGITYTAIRYIGVAATLMHRDFAVGLQSEIDSLKAAIVPGFVAPVASAYAEAKAKANARVWYIWAGLAISTLICFWNFFSALNLTS